MIDINTTLHRRSKSGGEKKTKKTKKDAVRVGAVSESKRPDGPTRRPDTRWTAYHNGKRGTRDGSYTITMYKLYVLCTIPANTAQLCTVLVQTNDPKKFMLSTNQSVFSMRLNTAELHEDNLNASKQDLTYLYTT